MYFCIMKNISEEKLRKWFEISCIWEAISCALLFLVAMPIKYQFGYVLPMPFAGCFHGFWFSAYLILLYVTRKYYKWDDEDFIFYIMFAFIPFATLALHKKAKIKDNEKSDL